MVRAIRRIDPGGSEAQLLLARVARESSDRYRQLAALRCLGDRPSSSPETARVVSSFLGHEEANFRGTASAVLGAFGESAASAIPELSRLLDDPDGEVRLIAAASLVLAGSDAPDDVARLLPLLLEARKRSRAWTSCQAVRALGKLARCDSNLAIHLVRALDDGISSDEAVAGLASLRELPQDAKAALLDRLSAERPLALRRAALLEWYTRPSSWANWRASQIRGTMARACAGSRTPLRSICRRLSPSTNSITK